MTWMMTWKKKKKDTHRQIRQTDRQTDKVKALVGSSEFSDGLVLKHLRTVSLFSAAAPQTKSCLDTEGTAGTRALPAG